MINVDMLGSRMSWYFLLRSATEALSLMTHSSLLPTLKPIQLNVTNTKYGQDTLALYIL